MHYPSALIVGLGESGDAAASLLLGEGTAVTVTDQSDGPEVRAKAAALEQRGARVLLGACSAEAGAAQFARGPDVAVISPGVRGDSDLVKGLEAKGIPVISELELGASRCACPILAITGSNGKSTMTKLCAEALALAGRRSASAGNYGRAVCRAAAESRDLDWLVVEVSSFQLEKVRSFRPRVGVLLNIQPNHLDRHGSLETYVALKMRLFERMGKGDVAIVHDECAAGLPAVVAGLQGEMIATAFGLSGEADYRFGGNRVWLRPGRRLEPVGATEAGGRNGNGSAVAGSVGFENTVFANEILGLTAAAAVAAVEACGEDPAVLARAARTFEPLPHRMQKVGEVRGVAFVDDSKATNLSALRAALQVSSERVALIAGGLLKETDLRVPEDVLAQKVKGAYLIGRDGPRLMSAWSSVVPCRVCGSLEEAVRAAWAERSRVDTILLSPGCTSFDQFEDFEDRGRQFTSIAAQLKGEEERQ
jgi:UDP-N-acetylmuramoylalanine--D-glutamate ligase